MIDMHRPLLLLLDRNLDIHTLLHHPWNYLAITHDILGINYGKINTVSAHSKKSEYEFDFLNDPFLIKNGL